MITFGSVASGIEAASVAFNPIGWHAAWLAEIEAAPNSVLRHHYPDVPNLGDMTKIAHLIRDGFVPAPDVFCGGTPCQAFSVAGLRNSLDDARGNLSLTFCEIANDIDDRRAADGFLPAVIVWENVPGVLSTKDNAFGCFLAGLAGEDDPIEPTGSKWTNAGCVFGPRRTVAWRVLDAQYFGVAQRRRRVFVVASARDGFDPTTVLFEFEGVRRDSAPRRETRKENAGTIVRSVALRGREGGATAELGDDLAGCLRASSGGGDKPHAPAPIAFDSRQDCVSSTSVFGALGSSSPQAQAVAFSCKDHGADATVELSPTMRAMGHQGSHANAGGQLAVCITGDITHTLKAEGFDASEDGTGRGQPIVAACYDDPRRFNGPHGGVAHGDLHPTLESTNPKQFAQVGMAVRRLTPRECERLQGFPDDYTLVPHRGKPTADGPRYKALGNSWAVPNVAWIGRRIAAQLQ